MKTTILTTLMILSISLICVAQDKEAVRLTSYIKSGDAMSISNMCLSNVDLSVLENEGIYGQPQTKGILASFFKKHQPKSFKVEHKGKSRMNDHYRIGTLETKRGTFRVTFFLKTIEGKFYLKQLRIEEDQF